MSRTTDGHARVRARRYFVEHTRQHARDAREMDFLVNRETKQREKNITLAVHLVSLRERIAALEAEVARLAGHHPAPAASAEPAAKPGPAPVAVKAPSILDVVRANPGGVSIVTAVRAAFPDGTHADLAESIVRELQNSGLVEVVRYARTGETMLYPAPAPTASDLSGLAAWSSRT